MSAWNVGDLHKMALPPCHMTVQFYVANGTLSSHLFQRSADIGLGVPFNITSYALLTHMIAHVTNLKPGEFVHTMSDTHIYATHMNALREQALRIPYHFPKLEFTRKVKDIDDFKVSDFYVSNYKHHPHIKMTMAI